MLSGDLLAMRPVSKSEEAGDYPAVEILPEVAIGYPVGSL
jgi:hypothetical protein